MTNLTQAQTRELKKVNTEGVVKVWKNDKVLRIYKTLESKGLVQVAWSTNASIDYKVPGKNTVGMY